MASCTGNEVARVRICVSALSCCGSRCCTSTNPMPVSSGKCWSNCVNACRPPAEAPTPTTGKPVAWPDGEVLGEYDAASEEGRVFVFLAGGLIGGFRFFDFGLALTDNRLTEIDSWAVRGANNPKLRVQRTTNLTLAHPTSLPTGFVTLRGRYGILMEWCRLRLRNPSELWCFAPAIGVVCIAIPLDGGCVKRPPDLKKT